VAIQLLWPRDPAWRTSAHCEAPLEFPGRNVGMGLERQLNDTKPMSDEDGGSVLAEVAERAKEVVPVQDRSRGILPVVGDRQIRVTHDADLHGSRAEAGLHRAGPTARGSS